MLWNESWSDEYSLPDLDIKFAEFMDQLLFIIVLLFKVNLLNF